MIPGNNPVPADESMQSVFLGQMRNDGKVAVYRVCRFMLSGLIILVLYFSASDSRCEALWGVVCFCLLCMIFCQQHWLWVFVMAAVLISFGAQCHLGLYGIDVYTHLSTR